MKRLTLTLCATCLWRCGFGAESIDVQLGRRGAINAARAKYGHVLVPARYAGGRRPHGTHHTIQQTSGCADRAIPVLDAKLIHDVEHAYYTMPRPPLEVLRLRRRLRQNPSAVTWARRHNKFTTITRYLHDSQTST